MLQFRRLLTFLVAGTLGVATLTAVAPVAPAAASPAEPRAWAPEWMVRHDRDYTEGEARDIARRYDVVTAHPNTFDGLVGAMKAENPRLTLLTYVNGPFAANWLPDYPESWYAHNAAGRRVRAVRFDSDLMNVQSPQWRDEIVRLCDDMLQRSGYDGCFLDSLGNGLLQSGYLDSDPIDPRTGRVWSPAQYIKDTSALAANLRARRPNIVVAANGLGSGPTYYSNGLAPLADATDIAMAEAWLRAPIAAIDDWPSLGEWQRSVDMIADAEQRGSGVLTVTKIWTTASDAQRRQWYDYAFGSFLLGSTSRSRFFFIKDGCRPPCSANASPLSGQWSPDVALGTPAGAYQAQGGAYVRRFGAGFVAVNPNDGATTVTPPNGTFRDQRGAAVSGPFTLAPHTAAILTGSAQTPPATDPIVGIGLTPGTQLGTGPTTTVGLATDDTSVAKVDVSVRNLATDRWLQTDGSWRAAETTVPADLLTPGKPTSGWRLAWHVPEGAFVMHATAFDNKAQASKAAVTIFTAATDSPPPPPPPSDATCRGLRATMTGTAGDDVIVGTAGRDVIVGLGGADRISGLAGDDVICAGTGSDVVDGGSGVDRISGGTGADIMRGADGADLLHGNTDDDRLAGGAGRDTCHGGGGRDRAVECERTPWVELRT